MIKICYYTHETNSLVCNPSLTEHEYRFSLPQRESNTIDLDSVTRSTGACNWIKKPQTNLPNKTRKTLNWSCDHRDIRKTLLYVFLGVDPTLLLGSVGIDDGLCEYLWMLPSSGLVGLFMYVRLVIESIIINSFRRRANLHGWWV